MFAVSASRPRTESPAPAVVPVRPLGFRERLDLPYALILANIRLLAGLSLAAVATAEALVVLAAAAADAADPDALAPTVVAVTVPAAWLTRAFLRAATVVIGLSTVWGPRLALGAALRRLGAVAAPLLGVAVLQTLSGVVLLTLGIGLMIVFPLAPVGVAVIRAGGFLAVPVLIAEGAGLTAAFGRSRLLVERARWQITGLWTSMRLVLLVLVAPLLGLVLLTTVVSGTQRWAVVVVASAAAVVIAAFDAVIDAATRVVAYVDRRCLREAADLPRPALPTPGVRV